MRHRSPKWKGNSVGGLSLNLTTFHLLSLLFLSYFVSPPKRDRKEICIKIYGILIDIRGGGGVFQFDAVDYDAYAPIWSHLFL